MTRIARGRERMKSSAGDQLERGEEPRLEHRVGDHHQPRVVAQALLHDRLDRRALQRRATCATWASTPGRSATSRCR